MKSHLSMLKGPLNSNAMNCFLLTSRRSGILHAATTKVTYQIETPRRPKFSRHRRLAPDRSRLSKAEFNNLLELGTYANP